MNEISIEQGIEAIDTILLPSERERFLAAVARLNPSLDGAHVDDVLAIMLDADAGIEWIEPLAETYGDEWTATHAAAAEIVIVLDPASRSNDPQKLREGVEGLVERLSAQSDPHGYVEHEDGVCSVCTLGSGALVHHADPDDGRPDDDDPDEFEPEPEPRTFLRVANDSGSDLMLVIDGRSIVFPAGQMRVVGPVGPFVVDVKLRPRS